MLYVWDVVGQNAISTKIPGVGPSIGIDDTKKPGTFQKHLWTEVNHNLHQSFHIVHIVKT